MPLRRAQVTLTGRIAANVTRLITAPGQQHRRRSKVFSPPQLIPMTASSNLSVTLRTAAPAAALSAAADNLEAPQAEG